MLRLLLLIFFAIPNPSEPDPALGERLLVAARKGNAEEVKRLLECGAAVNTKNRYNLTPVYYASDRGHTEVVLLLLEAGAEMNIKDEPFYRLNPLVMAARKNHAETVRLLLRKGAAFFPWVAIWPASLGHKEVIEVIVNEKELGSETLNQLWTAAIQNGHQDLGDFLVSRGATENPDAIKPPSTVLGATSILPGLDGEYIQPDGSHSRVWFRRGKLFLGSDLEIAFELAPVSETRFTYRQDEETSIDFEIKNGKAIAYKIRRGDEVAHCVRADDSKGQEPSVKSRKRAHVSAERSWPQFRGPNGSGVADLSCPPVQFDAGTGRNVAWKVSLPGVAHAAPVSWKDKVFVVTATSENADARFALSYESGFDTHPEADPHTWMVHCLSLSTGRTLWESARSDRVSPRCSVTSWPATPTARLLLTKIVSSSFLRARACKCLFGLWIFYQK